MCKKGWRIWNRNGITYLGERMLKIALIFLNRNFKYLQNLLYLSPILKNAVNYALRLIVYKYSRPV
jgi:hypothetical protein